MNWLRFKCSGIFMQRQNRRRITSIASPFMRANLTPEPRIASLDMAPHLSACMRTRSAEPVPGQPNPGQVDPEIYAFDFHRTIFDQWTFSPGCDRSAHRNTWEQGLGQTHHKIPFVSTRHGRFLPPSDNGIGVHEGSHSWASCLCTRHHNPWNSLMKQTWFKFVQIWNIV